ncbi:MAG TPA: tRNA guanosine(34) transglycosylase Tgt, partial [Thermodesulfobacterium commune]|nr:tRNA guanosine(34) transglycosylase Tgt [Thermodesulfobacterium commune]
LFHTKELLVYQLLTLHNLFYYAKLIEKIKQSIKQETLLNLIQELKELYLKNTQKEAVLWT